MPLSPALRRLLALRLRGMVRRQGRRMRTVKGALLTLLGVGLIGLWLAGVVASQFVGDDATESSPWEQELSVRAACFALTLLSLSSALVHRGLFLPREEIERLFSAPISRSDLVRYRLVANSGRSLFGGLLIGLIAMGRLPQPALALVGIVVGMSTLPVLHQLIAILLGGIERGLARRLRTLGSVALYGGLALCGFLVWLVLTDRDPATAPVVGPVLQNLREVSGGKVLAHPWVASVTTPFIPWARMIGATEPVDFLAWFAICMAILLGLAELTARLPLDFRELSLETAASVAARIRRVRKGGGAAAGRASTRTAGWRVPWVFGRGVAGAVAWRKAGAIVRKAKGTLLVSALVLAFLTVLSRVVAAEEEVAFVAPLFIAGFGTFYLCAGLRFDFREDLDRMETIKAWPVAPARLFFATLLPEVCLVSLLLAAAVLLRSVLAGGFHPVTIGVLGLLPLVVFAWVALDNAVFLFAPVRFVPGQEGALQNAGRGLLLMLVRMVLLALVGLVGAAAVMAMRFLGENVLHVSSRTIFVATLGVLWVTIFLVDAALVWVGGWLVGRFDVARDRG